MTFTVHILSLAESIGIVPHFHTNLAEKMYNSYQKRCNFPFSLLAFIVQEAYNQIYAQLETYRTQQG